MPTAVKDNVPITLAEVKEFLRIDDTDQDVVLQMAIDGAVDIADAYIDRDLVDYPGSVIPSFVKTWCLKFIGLTFERRSLNLLSNTVTGLGEIEWSDESLDSLRDLAFIRKYPPIC